MKAMMQNVFIIVLILFTPYAVAKKSNGKKIIVDVCSLLPAAEIRKRLDPDKYTVEVLKIPDYVTAKSACEAIWLGDDIPVDKARKVITSAIDAGITLHYIGIDGDDEYDTKPLTEKDNRTIVIGGSTKAAIRQGVEKLNYKELRDILSAKNDKEFHKKIRSTYSIFSKSYWISKSRH